MPEKRSISQWFGPILSLIPSVLITSSTSAPATVEGVLWSSSVSSRRRASMEARRRLETLLDQSTPSTVAGADVLEVISTDGIKLRMGPNHWLMLRFSGTEPLLRLYCEGPDAERVNEVLAWARQFAEAA